MTAPHTRPAAATPIRGRSVSTLRCAEPETSRSDNHGLNFRALNLAILYAVQSGFRYSAIACQLSLVCLACVADPWKPTLRAVLPGITGDAAPSSRAIPWRQASRFRPTFQVLFCLGPMLTFHALDCNFAATRARGTPLRSGRGGNGASPAAANKAATGADWPAPSSTTSMPSAASKAGAAAAMIR